MRPDEHEIDEELRGHLAIEIQERIDRGEDPARARRAALAELGYVPRVRDSIRAVWYTAWFDAAMDLGRDLRVGLRSLIRARALSAAVILTLALGIGANAAIFSVVRGVLLRPLVNRAEDRLVYIRQSAPGIGATNMTFSVPEIDDLKARTTRGSPRPVSVKSMVEKSPSAEIVLMPDLRSLISGTEKFEFSLPAPGALWRM